MRTLRLERVLALELDAVLAITMLIVQARGGVRRWRTEPLVMPSKPCLPLTVTLVPLGAFSLTSRVAAYPH
jgi:hypothetical protein